MPKFSANLIIGASLMLALTIASPVQAGSTAEKLERAGFVCFVAGPSDFVHCWRAKDFSEPAISVMVFDQDGTRFMGTELLVHEDQYSDQPCPQDGGDWDYMGAIPYFACHHFYTGHHD